MAQCSSAGGETRGGRRRTEEEAGDKWDKSKQAQIRRPKISCDENQQITRAKDSFCDKKKVAPKGARGLWSEPVAAHEHGLQTAQFHMVAQFFFGAGARREVARHPGRYIASPIGSWSWQLAGHPHHRPHPIFVFSVVGQLTNSFFLYYPLPFCLFVLIN